MKNLLIKFAVWVLTNLGNDVGKWHITINGDNVRLSKITLLGSRTGIRINGNNSQVHRSHFYKCRIGVLIESKESCDSVLIQDYQLETK